MSATTPSIYYVAGGTGRQGGAVIEHLLNLTPKPTVRTLSRDLNSDKVKELQRRGVEVIEGTQGDKEAVLKGTHGAAAAFSMQQVLFTALGIDSAQEISAARILAEAAVENNVQILVHSSVQATGIYDQFKDWATQQGMTTYWEAKSGAEEAVKKSGVKNWVILRPCYFMSNLLSNFMNPLLASKGELLSAADKLELVAENDIGAFVVAAFLNPQKFNNREITLSSQVLDAHQIADVIQAVSGKKVKVVKITEEEARKDPTLSIWIPAQVFAQHMIPYILDPAVLQKEYPEVKLTTLKEYLTQHKDKLVVGDSPNV